MPKSGGPQAPATSATFWDAFGVAQRWKTGYDWSATMMGRSSEESNCCLT